MLNKFEMPVTLIRAVTSQAPLTGKWLESLNSEVTVVEIDKTHKVYNLVNTITPTSLSVISGRPDKLTVFMTERNIGIESDTWLKEVVKFS